MPAAFGRFRVLHQIGAGSLGPVFRGEDPTDGRIVAIKVIRLNLTPEKAHDVVEGLRALQERLPPHPAVADLLAAGLHDGHPYFVSAFAAGQSLDVALREFGPAVLPDALPRLRALASGLDACAESWSWHGNLHPRDIVIEEARTLLVGLGVAPILERTGARVPMRRPYTALEVIGGRPTSPASDQYALAAIAFEWLFGRRAPGPAGAPLTMPALPGVDRDVLSEAFSSALAADPGLRFESCSAFAHAIGRAVSDEELSTKEETSARDGGRVAPRPLPLVDEEPGVAGHEDIDEDAEAMVRAEVAAVADAVADLMLARETTEAAAPAVPGVPLEVHADEPAIFEPVALEPFVEEPLIDDVRVDDARVDEPAVAAPAVVAWQGSLSATAPEPPSRRGFGGPALVAALVVGAVIGAAAMFAVTRSGPADPSAVASREFTDAPLAAETAEVAKAPAPETPESKAAAAAPREPAVAPALGTGTSVAVAPAVRAKSTGGRLLVRSTPSGAAVQVNGVERGVTPLTLHYLPLGTHTVRVSRPGFSRAEQRITLTAERPSRSVEARLVSERAASPAATPSRAEAREASTGTLTVDSRPAGSSVSIDGRDVGRTPLTLRDVRPGVRTVRITRPGYRPWTTTVTIEAGKPARVAASLGTDEH